MKKIIAFICVLCLVPSLCGCGSIYTNYRRVEDLLVIQTLGLDYISSGVSVTLASSSNSARGESPTYLEGTGETISAALSRIRNLSNEQALFFSHINGIVIGETAAHAGIEDYLTYTCRSADIRVDIPLFVIRDGTAKETIYTVGGSTSGISEVLQAVKESVYNHGWGELYTVADILRDNERYGSALVCALSRETASETGGESVSGGGAENGGGSEQQEQEQSRSGSQEQKTVAADGYAVIKNGRLCGYVEAEDAMGVGFLKNSVGISDIVVKDMHGAPVSLEISGGGAKIKPIWDEDGSLHGIDVTADVRASVIETVTGSGLDSAEYCDHLTSQLESAISRRISAVLRLSRELEADFLGLAGMIEADAPKKYQDMGKPFTDCLSDLELQITVSGTLIHTNDIKDGA